MLAMQDKQDSLRPLQQDLEAERGAHVDTRDKLSALKSALDRKAALADDLKRRNEALLAAADGHQSMSDRLSAAEGGVKALQITLAKKNSSIKEVCCSAACELEELHADSDLWSAALCTHPVQP
jgi:chromosome segregation ATPase